MAKNTPRSKNDQFPNSPRTVDRQMVTPVDLDKAFFPVVSANPKRRELNPGERPSHENKTADAPEVLYGTRRQSRY